MVHLSIVRNHYSRKIVITTVITADGQCITDRNHDCDGIHTATILKFGMMLQTDERWCQCELSDCNHDSGFDSPSY